jgi:capsule synthesis protein PGA_cap
MPRRVGQPEFKPFTAPCRPLRLQKILRSCRLTALHPWQDLRAVLWFEVGGRHQVRIALTGDVMLGRLVDEYVIRNPALPPQTIWGEVLPLLLAADGRFINLECVIGTDGRPWRQESKAFHFRADPRAIEALQAARIDCVTLANNHSLDFGADVLLECFALLDQAGIRHAGAGR